MQNRLVAFCGGSCSGKSTFVQSLVDALGEDICTRVSQDSYYRDQTHIPISHRYKLNYDHPDALDMDLFTQHLSDLKTGKSVEAPIFDYTPCARLAETKTLNPRPIILVDGILLLHSEQLRKLMDMIVFIEAPADARLLRRLDRDVKLGMKIEDTLEMWGSYVLPMHDTFIEPYKTYAQMIIPNHDKNRQALKCCQEVLLNHFLRMVDKQ